MAQPSRDTIVKRMAELLRGGATLLAETCPLCNSPLLRLPSGETVCPIHGKIFVAKTEEEVAEATVLGVLTELEKSISSILSMYARTLKNTSSDPDIAKTLVYWLEALERIERIKAMVSQHRSTTSAQTERKVNR